MAPLYQGTSFTPYGAQLPRWLANIFASIPATGPVSRPGYPSYGFNVPATGPVSTAPTYSTVPVNATRAPYYGQPTATFYPGAATPMANTGMPLQPWDIGYNDPTNPGSPYYNPNYAYNYGRYYGTPAWVNQNGQMVWTGPGGGAASVPGGPAYFARNASPQLQQRLKQFYRPTNPMGSAGWAWQPKNSLRGKEKPEKKVEEPPMSRDMSNVAYPADMYTKNISWRF